MVRRLATLFVVTVALTACGGSESINCTTNEDCLQGGITGQCLDSPVSSEHWCAFSDPGCTGTALRWGVKSGDDLAAECVAAGATVTLTVSAMGAGTGHVASEPVGIDCPGSCSAEFAAGTAITLSATADAGSFFDGFGAPCSGSACIVTLAAPTTVEATFLVSGSTKSALAIDQYVPQLITEDGSFIGYEPRALTVIQVEKRNADGAAPLWTTSVTAGGDSSSINGMALLPDGDVIVAADGTTGIGGLEITYPDVALVARLDGATGTARWVVGFPQEDIYTGRRLAVDTTGNIYFSGTYRGPTTIGGVSLGASSASDRTVFVAKLDDMGHFAWVKPLGNSSTELSRSVAVGKDGLPVVLLQTAGNTDVGTGSLNGFGGTDCVVAKLAANDGHTLISQVVGSMMSDDCPLVAASPRSSEFAIVVEAGGAVKTSTENFAGPGTLILGFSAAGVRNRAINTTSTTLTPNALVFGDDDSLWQAGEYTGAISLGGSMLPDSGTHSSGFIAHYSAADAHLLSSSIGGAATASAQGVLIRQDEIHVLGYFSGLASFGSTTLTAGPSGSGFDWALVP